MLPFVFNNKKSIEVFVATNDIFYFILKTVSKILRNYIFSFVIFSSDTSKPKSESSGNSGIPFGKKFHIII